MTNVDSVAIKDAPIVFVGYGVKAPERNWDDFKGLDLKGKVLVVLINDPDFETGPDTKNGGDFGGKAMTYYGRWTYKFEEAARQGAGRGADRPRDRAGLVRLGHGQEFQHQHDVRHRPPGTRQGPSAPGILDPARRRRRPVQGRRPGFRRAEEAGPVARLQAGGAEGRDLLGQLRRRPLGDRLQEHRRPDQGDARARRDGDLQRPLGPPGRRPAGRQGRQDLQRRASTTPTASPPSWSWPAPSRASRPRSARSCSWPSPPRSAACWARNTTRPIRCTRCPRPSPT